MSLNTTGRYSRRKVLEATAGFGAFAGIVPSVTASSGPATTTITTHKRGTEPLVEKEVPRRWKAQFESAKRAKEAIARRYMENSAVRSIALTGTDERIHGKRTFRVKVEVDPRAERPSIPTSVGDVPVETLEYTEREPMYCHGNSDYDTLPGGVILDGATSGSPYFYDHDGDGNLEAMHLTAAHILQGDNCDSLTGTSVMQKQDNWGTVEVHNQDNDYVLCTPDSGYYVTDTIEEPGGSVTVTGYVTKDGLADLRSNDTTIYKTGISTARESGTVEDLGVVASDPACANYDWEGVGLDVNVYPGDSGGPIYDKGPYGAAMIGITSAGYNDANTYNCEFDNLLARTEGPSAYHIKNHQGGRFSSPYI